MKKSLILIICLILASIGVFTQQTSTVECPSYTQSFTACQTTGGTVISGVDVNGCNYLQECKMPTGSTTTTPTMHCGDGNCDPNENRQSCPADCTSGDYVCGNGKCEYGESSGSCPSDCGSSSSSQNQGFCLTLENQKKACTSVGGTVISGTDWSGGCEYIKCRQSDNKNSVLCQSIPEQKTACVESGGVVMPGMKMPGDGCDYINCDYSGKQTTNCPTSDELERLRKTCEKDGKYFNSWSRGDGCYEFRCETPPQMDCSWTNQERERCKLSGGSPREEKMDSYGGMQSCPMIVCDYSTTNSFASKEDCENKTGCFCEYRMCDMVPAGKSYESFCGKNFKQGYYCMMKKPSNGIIECGGSSASYCPMDYYCDYSQESNKGKCVKNNNYEYSCPEERPEELERRNVECEKVGGKLVKQKNNWGSSSCNYSMCVSQNLKCGSTSSSVGMLMCPEGYYCEQSMNPMNPSTTPYPSYNYQSPQGKCIKVPNGIVVKTCPELNPVIKEKCYTSGGIPTIKKDGNGCEVYACEQKSNFCGGIAGIQCPQGYMCELDGNYPDAGGKCYPAKCPVMEEESIEEQKQKCLNVYNGKFEVKTDARGCVYTECGLKDTVTCMIDVDVKEALNKCIKNNGDPKVKSNEGCVREVSCLIKSELPVEVIPGEKPSKPALRDLPPEEKKDQDLGKLFNVAFKLEEVRMQFDSLKRKTSSIADYYEQQGDMNYAEKFKIVSKLLDNAINEVDNVKADLRSRIDNDAINEETFSEIKQALSNVKNNMKDVLKELLR